MTTLLLSLGGTLIAVYSGIIYIRSILRGPTRPHTVTWGGWALASTLGFFSSLAGGAKWGLLVAGVFVLIEVITFSLSLFSKYGKPGGQKTDYIFGLIAGLGLISWQIFHFSPAAAATIAVACDAVFVWFTLREAWLQPETEELKPWVFGTIAVTLGLISLGNFSYAAVLFPAYLVAANLAIVGVLVIQKSKKGSGPVRKQSI